MNDRNILECLQYLGLLDFEGFNDDFTTNLDHHTIQPLVLLMSPSWACSSGEQAVKRAAITLHEYHSHSHNIHAGKSPHSVVYSVHYP